MQDRLPSPWRQLRLVFYGACGMRAGYRQRASVGPYLDFGLEILARLLGVAEQHVGVFVEEDWVLDVGVAAQAE